MSGGQGGTYSNAFTRDVDPIPIDPGGPLTRERLMILKIRAVKGGGSWYGWHSDCNAAPLIEVCSEVERLMGEAEDRARDAALIDRLLVEVPWRIMGLSTIGLAREWPPPWLREAVESGRADAQQADRAEVTAMGLAVRAIEWPADKRWYRHGEPPRDFDRAAHESARRVLARCERRDQ